MKLQYVLLGLCLLLFIAFIGFNYYELTKEDVLLPEANIVEEENPTYINDVGLAIPDRFSLSLFAEGLPSVRVLTFDDRGVMLASLMQEGKVVALPDMDGDGKADSTEVLLEGLNAPHGLLVQCGAQDGVCTLYVAQTDALISYPYNSATRELGPPERLTELPNDGGHSTRSLHMHPDGTQILLAVGSKCNVCEEEDERRATVLSYDLSSGELSTFASGLRNTVFMATDPVTGEVWGTDNGRDQLGEDIPPDEVNILSLGDNFGWPYCYGQNIADATLGVTAVACAESVPSHIDIQAHSAPLGLSFIPEEGYPEEMRNDLLVAYHGSWNRTIPTGYKVVRFDLAPDTRNMVSGPHDFLGGFLEEGQPSDTAFGRPVAVTALPGGTVYISDDARGVIYVMQYHGTDYQ